MHVFAFILCIVAPSIHRMTAFSCMFHVAGPMQSTEIGHIQSSWIIEPGEWHSMVNMDLLYDWPLAYLTDRIWRYAGQCGSQCLLGDECCSGPLPCLIIPALCLCRPQWITPAMSRTTSITHLIVDDPIATRPTACSDSHHCTFFTTMSGVWITSALSKFVS